MCTSVTGNYHHQRGEFDIASIDTALESFKIKNESDSLSVSDIASIKATVEKFNDSPDEQGESDLASFDASLERSKDVRFLFSF